MAVADHLQQRHIDTTISIVEFSCQLLVAFIGFLVVALDEVEVGKFSGFHLRRRILIAIEGDIIEGSEDLIGYFGGLLELASKELYAFGDSVSHEILELTSRLIELAEGVR